MAFPAVRVAVLRLFPLLLPWQRRVRAPDLHFLQKVEWKERRLEARFLF